MFVRVGAPICLCLIVKYTADVMLFLWILKLCGWRFGRCEGGLAQPNLGCWRSIQLVEIKYSGGCKAPCTVFQKTLYT